MRHRCVPVTGCEEVPGVVEIICNSLPDCVFAEGEEIDPSFCILSCQLGECASRPKRGKRVVSVGWVPRRPLWGACVTCDLCAFRGRRKEEVQRRGGE